MRRLIRLSMLVLTGGLLASAAPGEEGASAQEPAARDDHVTLYACRSYTTNLGGDPGALTLEKAFREDGSVYRLRVSWEDRQGSFLRRHLADDQLSAELHWPGNHPFSTVPVPFDWSQGSIRAHIYGPRAAARYRPHRREVWSQVFVVRNRSMTVHHQEGVPILVSDPSQFLLASGLLPRGSPSDLWISIDALIAWGTGARSVTVYETLVTRRRFRRNSYPNSPDGRRRIVAVFDVDTVALARKVEQIREATGEWEASIADFRNRCERVEEYTGPVHVT